MPRVLLASTCSLVAACTALGLAACSSAPVPPPGVFGGTGLSLFDPASKGPDPLQVAATEADLRHRLVQDKDPLDAALMLVDLLEQEERHREALFLIDTLSRRFAVEAAGLDADPEQARSRALEASSGTMPVDVTQPRQALLMLARMRLLRDLGRRHEAVATLQSLIDVTPPRKLHPALWFELAQLRWLEGERFASRRALQSLLDYHAEHPWTSNKATEIADLDVELRNHSRPQRVTVRDLLGNLRGCPDAKERRRIFEKLAGQGGAIKKRALMVLLDDADGMLRAQATAQVQVPTRQLSEFCAAGLADPNPLVRAAAAGRAVSLAEPEAVSILLPTMAAEQNAEAFAGMHAVLAQLSGRTSDLTTEAAADPAQRARVVAEWRKAWER